MKNNLKKENTNIINNNFNISINELNKMLQKAVNNHNNVGIDDFEGLSPEIMYNLLYGEYDNNNIIKINPEKHLPNDIPIIKLIIYFLNRINDSKELKLTKIGNIPPIIVKDIYNEKILSDYIIESGITKLTKETDVYFIMFMKFICEISGLTKKKNNKLYLTKKAEKVINSHEIFEIIFSSAFKKYNWACFDAFENTMIGQFGNNFSLFLLSKYRNEWKDNYFFAKLYFKAFPDLLDRIDKNSSFQCYNIRTFERLLKYFGFIEFKDKKWNEGKIKTTDIFEKYIKIGLYCT
jgi:hypothetical protein